MSADLRPSIFSKPVGCGSGKMLEAQYHWMSGKPLERRNRQGRCNIKDIISKTGKKSIRMKLSERDPVIPERKNKGGPSTLLLLLCGYLCVPDIGTACYCNEHGDILPAILTLIFRGNCFLACPAAGHPTTGSSVLDAPMSTQLLSLRSTFMRSWSAGHAHMLHTYTHAHTHKQPAISIHTYIHTHTDVVHNPACY